MPFFLPAHVSIASLWHQLRKTGVWGQIVGPHGSGKSTLVQELRGHWENEGIATMALVARAGQWCLPKKSWPPQVGALLETACRRSPPTSPPLIVVVDGYEQLAFWWRWRVRSACRRFRWGLLVTCHRDLGLPTLYRTAPTEELALQIAHYLMRHESRPLLSAEDVANAWKRHRADLRSLLFDLYDRYESRRHGY